LLDDDLTQSARGVGQSRPYPRGLPPKAKLAFGLAVVAFLLLASVIYARQKAVALEVQLVADLRSGQGHLEAGKVALKLANEQHSEARIAEAQANFASAKKMFGSAKDEADGSLLLSVFARIPGPNLYFEPRLAAVDGVAEMGINLANAASTIASLDLRLLNPQGSTSAGTKLLATLRTSTTQINSIRADLDRALRAVDRVDSSVLPAADRSLVDKARSTIENAANGVAEFQRLTPALVEILGGNGRRVYLIEQVNAAELRSGGGFIGTESIVSADNGTLKLVSSGDSYAFDGYLPYERPRSGSPAYVQPPNSLSGFLQGYSWNFEDSNFFPDFASNAKWAAYFADRRRGLKVDGVFALDYYAVAEMLKVVGPISVPGYGVTFDATNLVNEVFTRDISDPTHKSILAAAAVPLIDHISALPANRWPQLLQVMNEAVVQGHLQVHFNNNVAQAEMARLGWSGALNSVHAGDFFMETEDNFGSNKANHFIVRRYTVTLSRSGGVLNHHVVIDINDEPGNPSWYPHGYDAYVRLYTPNQATGQRLANGTPEYRSQIPPLYPNNDPSTGYKLTDGWIYLVVGNGHTGHFQLIFDYQTPWTVDAAGHHVIYWQKQPGTLKDAITVNWQSGNRSFKAIGDLGQDQQITVSPNGVTVRPAQRATAHLPGLAL
jgi:hypothetical protein